MRDTSAARSAAGSWVKALQRRSHRLAQHARHRADGVPSKGIRAVGADDRVEQQALDVRGIGSRVGKRQLGPVRDAVDDHLVHADRPPHRLEVLDRVAGRVEGAARPDRLGAVGGGARHVHEPLAEPLEGGAAQRARAAGAPLVEGHDLAAVEASAQLERLVLGKRRGGLARAAGEGEERAAARARGRYTAHVQPHRPGSAPERSSGTSTLPQIASLRMPQRLNEAVCAGAGEAVEASKAAVSSNTPDASIARLTGSLYPRPRTGAAVLVSAQQHGHERRRKSDLPKARSSSPARAERLGDQRRDREGAEHQTELLQPGQGPGRHFLSWK